MIEAKTYKCEAKRCSFEFAIIPLYYSSGLGQIYIETCPKCAGRASELKSLKIQLDLDLTKVVDPIRGSARRELEVEGEEP